MSRLILLFFHVKEVDFLIVSSYGGSYRDSEKVQAIKRNSSTLINLGESLEAFASNLVRT